MLGVEKKEQIERSVLGSFMEYPSIGFKLVNKLSISHFSSDQRQSLFKHILSEKKKGRMFEIMNIKNPDFQYELKECFDKGHLVNLTSNINMLIEEGHINDLFKLTDSLKEMILDDKPLDKIIDHAKMGIQRVSFEDDEHVVSMKTAIANIEDGTTSHKEYPIDWPTVDKYMPVSSQNITIIGGNEGAFKTKLMMFMMRSLLFKYDNISVLWFSLEDPADKIIRGFISQSEMITDNELKEIEYRKLIPDDVKKFDVEFVTKAQTIFEITDRYKSFTATRDDRFCILIIDNLMKIIPVNHKIDPDLEILRELESLNVKTTNKERAVYLLHHFTKEALDKKNQFLGYEPKITHLRGSGRYKDAVTQAVLVNPLYSHSDIIKGFPDQSEFIKRLYLISIAKNRNNIKTMMRMLAYPEINYFKEI